MQFDDENLVGTTLGSYTLERLLGQGGMGQVYLARQAYPKRYVAVKVLYTPEHLSAQARASFYMRFRREADIIARLEHEHIIPLFEYDERDELAYLVMPYVSGGSLYDLLQRQNRLTMYQSLEYLSQAASALDYAHQQGVIHRDLKPSNFLLYPDGRLLLADFGIAYVPGGDSSNPVTPPLMGGLIGSVHYMAPELARGTSFDRRADIYSLGIVLFRMLSGDVPFKGENSVSVLWKQENASLPSLYRIDPSIPLAVDAVLHKATAKWPEERYDTAGEFVRALSVATNLPDPARQQSARYIVRTASTPAVAPVQRRASRPIPPSTYSRPPQLPQLRREQPAALARTLPDDEPVIASRPSRRGGQNNNSTASKRKTGSPPWAFVFILCGVFLALYFSWNAFSAFTHLTSQTSSRPSQTHATPIASATTTPAVTATSSNASSTEQAKRVVQQYYQAINDKKYRDAYNLTSPDFQQKISYAQFVAGYKNTVRDDITFDKVVTNPDGSVDITITIRAQEQKDTATANGTYSWSSTVVQRNATWQLTNIRQSVG